MRSLNLLRGAFIAGLGLAVAGWSNVTMNALFTNNMVLQHGMAVPVWGTASAGENISISINGQTKTAVAASTGAWKVVLDSLSVGGPFQMVVHGANTITLTNVMVGDVWLCSGQSNMELQVSACGYDTTAVAAGLSKIRLKNLRSSVGWAECSTTTVGPFSAAAFFFAKHIYDSLKIPIGLMQSTYGGTPIEVWMSIQSILDDPDLDTSTVIQGAFKAADLYKSAILPAIPIAMRGALWYQGEANAAKAFWPNKYQARMGELIKGWRAAWGQGDFPFYYVQLPNYNSGDDWPTIREAQRLTLKDVNNTGMAITIDIGDSANIHYRDKADVGYRLSLVALEKTYNHSKIVGSGPLFKSLQIKNDTAHLSFDYAGSGLLAKNGTLQAFQIATATDTNFVNASASISSREVIVYKPGSKIARVRYAYASNPQSTLYNKEGLPASPFLSTASDITGVERNSPINATVARNQQSPEVAKIYDLTGRCIGQRRLSNFTKMGTLRSSTGVFIVQTVSSDHRVINRKIMLFGKYRQPPLITGKG
jgi:sialate O-acetylesterase